MRITAPLCLCLLALSPRVGAQARRPPTATVSTALPRAVLARLVPLQVLSVRGDVQVVDGLNGLPPRPAQAGDTLHRGVQIRVGDDAVAALALPEGIRLTLLPGARLTAYAPTQRDPRATLTLLDAGAARVESPPSPTDRSFPLGTPFATVYLGRADGVVRALANGRIARISSHRGRFRVRGALGDFFVPESVGVSAEPGRRSSDHPLLAAPVWSAPPAAHVATSGHPVDVEGAFSIAPPARISRWRVELSRDESFRELVSVERLDGDVRAWRGRGLTPGVWWVRVSATDRDGYDSPPSSAQRIEVTAPVLHPSSTSQRTLASVRVPEGLWCALDGAPLARVDRPLRLSPARDHMLRCARDAEGHDAHDRIVPASESGEVTHDVRVRVTNWGEGVLTVTLRDAEGYAVPYANVTVDAGPEVAVSPMREESERGVYRAPVFWRGADPPALTLRVTLNGRVRFEERVTPEGAAAAIRR